MNKRIGMTSCLLAFLLCVSTLQAVPRGEFSVNTHPSIIGAFHVDMNTRDYDFNNPNIGQRIANSLGFGFALHKLLTLPGKYSQHKLFYLSYDNGVSGIFKNKFLYSGNLGFTIRTVIPFFKLTYGTGVNFKIGSTDYPPWGVYGIVGVDFHGFFLNSRVIFHPGKDVIENELQLGFMLQGGRRR